jgi:hypothetical protein
VANADSVPEGVAKGGTLALTLRRAGGRLAGPLAVAWEMYDKSKDHRIRQKSLAAATAVDDAFGNGWFGRLQGANMYANAQLFYSAKGVAEDHFRASPVGLIFGAVQADVEAKVAETGEVPWYIWPF